MAVVSVDAVIQLVGQVYEAAYDSGKWPLAMQSLQALLDGSRACIGQIGPQSAVFMGSVDDPELGSREAMEAFVRSPFSGIGADIPVGVVYSAFQLIDERQYQRSELWQGWCKPRDLYHDVSSNLLLANQTRWRIDVRRAAIKDPFGTDQISLLTKFLPHLRRAGQISQKFEKTSAFAAILSNMPFGILLVNGHRHVLHLNEAADALLQQPNMPLGRSGNEFVATNLKDDQQLQRMIAECCLLDEGMPSPGGTILLPSVQDGSGLRRIVVSVSPCFDAQAYGLTSERRAVVMIREVAPDAHAEFEGGLRELFDLTKAEARLACALASGRSLREASLELGVTFKTSRTYLERIFTKTKINQQTQLVALLNSARPLIGPSEILNRKLD